MGATSIYIDVAGGRALYILEILNVPVNFLTGDLDALKSQVFVLKEGIEYKVKITFKVR